MVSMRILNHRMLVVAFPMLSAALLSMSLIASNVLPAAARESHTDKVNQQQSGTQPSPTKHDNNGKSDKHANDKLTRMNQRINQLNECMSNASCWNWAQNILCVRATCIFGSVTPFLIPWQKEIAR